MLFLTCKLIIGGFAFCLVALKATFSNAQQRLIKLEKSFVYFKGVIYTVENEIFNYYIKFVAVGECEACF